MNIATDLRHERREPELPGQPVRVGVLVDLERGGRAGGHVKTWERLLQAAGEMPDALDLTVHFQGAEERTLALAPNARIVTLKPVFTTGRLPVVRNLADHTDLAPLHPRLRSYLARYDVIHATDPHFAYSGSARRVARQRGIPLVLSYHTDTPGFTRAYSERAIRRVFGSGALGRLLIDRLHLPDRIARRMARQRDDFLEGCDAILVSRLDELPAGVAATAPVSVLRRGIDKALFNPNKRDASRLRSTYAIPEERAILAFVGRLDDSKNVMVLARAARQLIERGRAVQVVFVGSGYHREAIAGLLGDHATFAGMVAPETVAWIDASADLFVFPAGLEVWPNAVLEAKAAGTPVIVAPGGGDIYVREPGADGLLVSSDSPAAWAEAIAALLADPQRRAAMGRAARSDVERNRPSWHDVLREDLLPVWRSLALPEDAHRSGVRLSV